MVTTSILIPAPVEMVWAAISDLASHVRWMADAESIEFDSTRRRGTGTRAKVATRIGPLHTIDVLEVVEWDEPHRITVAHTGVVTGRGSFDLVAQGGGTRLTWTETLTFPWWLGGRLTALAATPILTRVWRGNLRRLKQEIGAGGYSPTA